MNYPTFHCYSHPRMRRVLTVGYYKDVTMIQVTDYDQNYNARTMHSKSIVQGQNDSVSQVKQAIKQAFKVWREREHGFSVPAISDKAHFSRQQFIDEVLEHERNNC